MKNDVCLSTLAPGYTGYSTSASRRLFGVGQVSPFVDVDFDKEMQTRDFSDNVRERMARFGRSGQECL